MDDLKSQMITQTTRLDMFQESTLESLDEVKLATSGNTSDLRYLSEQVETLDNKSREKSIVIEGLLEKETDDEAKQLLTGYIQKELPDFKSEFIDSFYRIGRPKKKSLRLGNLKEPVVDNDQEKPPKSPVLNEEILPGLPATGSEEMKTPTYGEANGAQANDTESNKGVKTKTRSTVIGLRSSKWRDTILTRAADIRTNTGVKGFWINCDQNKNSRRKHQLVKACYERLRQNEYACSMKGAVITLRGRQYD